MMNNKTIKISLAAVLIAFAACAGFKYYEKGQDDSALKRKIGQMLVIGFRGTEINENSYISKAMEELNIGGVILFDKDNPSGGKEARNISDPEQVKKLIRDIKRFSPGPVFVSVDAEGGYVNRLKEKYGFKNIPSAQAMGESGNPGEAEEQAQILGAELSELGFNMDFAPVVDVNVNPDNPVIGYLERSFSKDPEKVYENAAHFIAGLHKYNIVTAIKHFPGHGSSTSDSHLGMVDVTGTYQDYELLPYQKLISDGYSDMVMTAHIMDTDIDPDYPATLSPLFVQGILRDRLGYKGVVISDDMQMGAIVKNYGFDEAVVRSVNAGCNMLILSNNGTSYDEKAPYEAVDAIFKAVRSGKIKESAIEESYDKIQNLKIKYGITI
jgi:beta-N-acetylhexosaminidase